MSGKLFTWNDLERVSAATYEDVPKSEKEAFNMLVVLSRYAASLEEAAVIHPWAANRAWQEEFAEVLVYTVMRVNQAIKELGLKFGWQVFKERWEYLKRGIEAGKDIERLIRED
jgi:hypothetical protein